MDPQGESTHPPIGASSNPVAPAGGNHHPHDSYQPVRTRSPDGLAEPLSGDRFRSDTGDLEPLPVVPRRRAWSRLPQRSAGLLALGLLVAFTLHEWSVWPVFFPAALGVLALQTYYHFCCWDKEEAVVVEGRSARRQDV